MLLLGFGNTVISTQLRDSNVTKIAGTTSFFPETVANSYDMVIITDQVFVDALNPLVEHKNEYGVSTLVKTTAEIYLDFDGRDAPEQIKYFIKYAVEEWNVSFVLLVGGLKSMFWSVPKDTCNHGTKGWYVPVRYTNMLEPMTYQIFDPGFISDLYYADIYDAAGNFSSWDSNDNGVFAEWDMRGTDEIDVLDLHPDVAVGRLACRNVFEVKTVVNKIIRYEKCTCDASWFKRFVAAGGDPLNDMVTEYVEGEVLGDHIIDNFMTEYDAVRLYSSFQNSDPCLVPEFKNIKRELDEGCGFFVLDAHGVPAYTKTYWPGVFDPENMIDCLSVYDFPLLRNKDKLPICVLGGCWCCQFNVSLFSFFVPKYKYRGRPTPESIGWRLVSKLNGGGIATVGFTALGYIRYLGENGDIDGDGIVEPDYVENGWGFLESCFFEAVDDGEVFLGDVWKAAELKYLSVFPVEDKYDWMEAKDLLAWTLLGDPSLKIGGYS